jgi:hypothetical protein
MWFAGACIDSADQPRGQAVGDASLGHCVSTPDMQATCYATFTEAIAAATGGRIADAPARFADVIDSDDFAARINALARPRPADFATGTTPTTAAANVVVGIVNYDPDYRGKDWVFLQNVGCDGNPHTEEYQVVNLNTSPYTVSDINDNIRSFRSFSSCQMVLYTDWYFGGTPTNNGVPITNMNNLWGLNDSASSIAWY